MPASRRIPTGENMSTPPLSPEIASAFAQIGHAERRILLALRARIFELAAGMDSVGPRTETLKWGQPSYLTEQTKSGTPLRVGCTKAGSPAMFVHCQTSVIRDVSALPYADANFEGNRALLVPSIEAVQTPVVSEMIQMALGYHLRRKQAAKLKPT